MGDRLSPESHLDFLRTSLSALGRICEDLGIDSQLARELSELPSQLPVPGSQAGDAPKPSQALEVIPAARASLGLLASAGYLNDQQVDGLASGLRSTLDSLEMELGARLRREPSARVYGLYVIIDPGFTGGRDPIQIARGALRGGAKMLQLRDKLREKGHALALAREMRELCSEYDALLIVNDHADLAAVVGSDGLHVGQGDLPISEARRILRPEQIIGRSNHLLKEVVDSQAQGADHVAVGSIYPTGTKASIKSRAPVGPEAVRKAREAVNLPLVAIGGINEENVEQVVKAGADAVCVTSAVGLAPDPEEASRRLVDIILYSGGKA